MRARVLDARGYALENSVSRSTPRLLVYRQRVEQNLCLMRRYMESVAPGSGFRHLTPHVKTHKSAWVTDLLLESGVSKFKCSLQELEMLLGTDARDIFVAYPLLPVDADRLAECIARYPGKSISAQIGCSEHASWLAMAARRYGVEIDCLLDLNVGYDRTGALPELAADIVREVTSSSWAGPVRIRGIHAYAGHNESPDPGERAAVAAQSMSSVVDCMRSIGQTGVRVERIVVAGTPSFLEDLRELILHHRVDSEVEASPGTWIYWDTHCEAIQPGMFDFAALLLAQVMDLPAPDRATLNLGSKRWSADKGLVQLFSISGLEVESVSEEHTVLRQSGETRLELGERLLFAPRHVCPTVNLWESFTVIGEGGAVERAHEPVTGRNR